MRFSLKEQMFFVRRLAFLTSSGVPLVEGLSILHAQARGKRQRRMLESVLSDIKNGQSLSRSCGKFPRAFGSFTISLLKIGEESGSLSACLSHLCEELKKRHVLMRKVVSAFIYPFLIALSTIGIVVFLMLYLFPKILPIFASLHMQLPLSTRLVMGVSTFLEEWGLLTLGVLLIVSIASVFLVHRNSRVHFYFDYLLLHMPAFGTVVRYYNTATITRTLGLLLHSGVPLTQALPIVEGTTKNLVYRANMRQISYSLERGGRISGVLSQTHYFPQMVGDMLAVGERSGTLQDTLMYLAEFYEHEVDDFTKNLSTLIEPALMVLMGLTVGFIAISIITPIYGITQNLHP